MPYQLGAPGTREHATVSTHSGANASAHFARIPRPLSLGYAKLRNDFVCMIYMAAFRLKRAATFVCMHCAQYLGSRARQQERALDAARLLLRKLLLHGSERLVLLFDCEAKQR